MSTPGDLTAFAAQAALDHLSARGALVVASAGNDGMDTDTTPHYPSSLPDDIIISVGAATRQNALWCAPAHTNHPPQLAALAALSAVNAQTFGDQCDGAVAGVRKHVKCSGLISRYMHAELLSASHKTYSKMLPVAKWAAAFEQKVCLMRQVMVLLSPKCCALAGRAATMG